MAISGRVFVHLPICMQEANYKNQAILIFNIDHTLDGV